MCGIAGRFNYKSAKPVERTLIQAMCNQMIHRGPDSEGIYIEDSVGIGMRRLSIIDVSGGDQPITNETESIWVICNGEIYNFQSLRKELEERGHSFKTKSDTEVIVHAYEEYGLECTKYFRGMFAFAIWDKVRRRLFLARDRLGQKPIYYHDRNGTFWFCSEMKSMLEDREIEQSVNLTALDYFFAFQYIPSPYTIFEGIQKLLPGHQIVVENGSVSVTQYWALNNLCVCRSEGEYIEKIRTLALEAVKLRLISDVPLGAFLSGGIDSSIIVGLMTKASNSQVKTFSIGFEEEEFNELTYARMISEKYGTDHNEFVVSADVVDLAQRLVQHFGEPFGDSSAIPTYYVSKMTRSKVTVALSGDAGDELFAGYSKYPILAKKNRFSPAIKMINQFLKGTLSSLNPSFVQPESFIRRACLSLLEKVYSVEERDYVWMIYLDTYFKGKLYSRALRENIWEDPCRKYYEKELGKSINSGVLDRILFADIHNYLPDDLNTKVDITSMANSLEVRSPFMDHKFVEFAASIPSHYKVKDGSTKWLLKKAFADILPDEIRNRKKMGFAIPIDKWFRTDLKSLFEGAVLGTSSRWLTEHFNLGFISHLFDAHQQCRANHGSKLWLILNYFLWHEAFMGN
ncbi:Asparagine synthetase [uncultured Desulfobacterium sp.]|uniref:asparagine synthase (glutamine-hydrolyzing) n=1 Tax=uncultured Desulfobacterium sp. TaxID=201089 RepID=A0A445N084_9BACT|nr:Asparagine synthetase [uncultured Desulfobacterium sp.]